MRVRRIFLKRSLRRTPGQFIIVALLVTIAAAMVHLAAVLAIQYPATLDNVAKELTTEQISIMLSSEQSARDAEKIVKGDSRIKDHAIVETLRTKATFAYGGKEKLGDVVIVEEGKNAPIGKSRILAEASARYTKPIWLPYSFNVEGGYELGDSFTMTFGGVVHRYHVQGFVENPMSGAIGNGKVEFRVDADEAVALASARGVDKSWQFRGLAKDTSRADDIGAEISSKLKNKAVREGVQDPVLLTIGWNLFTTGLMAPASVLIFAFVLFSTIVAVVAALVVRFAIRSTIIHEMPALGTQAALGFRSGHIARLLALPFAIVTLAASLAGAGIGIAFFPAIRQLVESQSGLQWSPKVGATGIGVAAGIMLFVVGITAFAVAKRTRKIPPVEALRGGEATHSFHSNYLPLETTRGPLSLVLGLKTALQARAQTIMIVLVIAMVSFASIFALAMYSALFKDPRRIVGIFSGDRQDITVSVAEGGSIDTLRKDLGAMPGVDRVQIFDNTKEADISGRSVHLSVADSYPLPENSRSIYKGRYPKSANEISLVGKLAGSLGVDVGDEVTADFGGGKATYLVTGLSQSIVRAGMGAAVTVEGAKRMNAAYQPKYVTLVLDHRQNIDRFVSKVKTEMRGRYSYVVNSYSIAESYVNPYLTMSKVMSFGILAVAGFMVMLVVSLVIGSAMVRSRRSFGVLKAAGFTNGQLMRHMLASYAPPVALGGVIGFSIGSLTVIPILEGLLKTFGVQRLDARAPFDMVVGLGVALLGITVFFVAILARKTRQVTARELLME